MLNGRSSPFTCPQDDISEMDLTDVRYHSNIDQIKISQKHQKYTRMHCISDGWEDGTRRDILIFVSVGCYIKIKVERPNT